VFSLKVWMVVAWAKVDMVEDGKAGSELMAVKRKNKHAM
jgi:hypothetical protein